MSQSKVRWLRLLAVGAGLLAVVAIGAILGFYLAFVRDLPDLESIHDYRPALATRVLDRNGELIGEYYEERRQLTPYNEIPDHVVRAFVAGEDSSFFEHSGVDFVSILRAAWVNLLAGGEIRQGGSTITQQMVKGLLLTPERNLRRKVREMVLARDIETRFSKQDILFLYLNQIYFGRGAYGIGEAARTYYDKPVSELTISEGAQLAGLPKAPSRYSPYANPDQAETRRVYVLKRMFEDGFLDAETYRAAVANVPVLHEPADKEAFEAASYFTEEVRRELFDRLGGDIVLTGGLTVETTLDIDLQRAAVKAVQDGLEALTKRQGYRGPLRKVAADEVTNTLQQLAEANHLLPDPEADPDAPDPAAALSGKDRLTGVVTAVDPEAKTARVGFAPGLEIDVPLSDVEWARTPNPKQAPRRVRAIEKVFSVGDVALFDVQRDAETEAISASLFQTPEVQGALLSLDVHEREALVVVGGYDYAASQFNRVTQARRQPGSSFKPFIYGAAFEKGYTAASIVHDRPIVYTDDESGFTWRPRNYGRSFYGPITLREALSRSVNNATVHLFRDVGVDYVMRYAHRLGIESDLSRDLSLALGSSVVSLLEITNAYAVYPAGGRRMQPVYIRSVKNRDGEVLLENLVLGAQRDAEGLAAVSAAPVGDEPALPGADMPEVPEAERVVTPEHAYLVSDLLRAVVVDPDGTGWRLRALQRPAAGKTGTTNDQADAWFMGFTPEITTGVWVGHDETRFLGWGETGSRAAAPIWVEYMQAAVADRPLRDFAVPEQIVFARVDRKTGLLADASSEDTVFQSFLADQVPTETSGNAQTQSEGRRLLRMDDF